MDFPHLRGQAEAFACALGAAGVPVRRLVLEGCDHLGASYASVEPDGPWVKAADALLTDM